MIKINKPTEVPAALLAKQNDLKEKMRDRCQKMAANEKPNFKPANEDYSTPIKTDLKGLYHNKCGFCEQKLSDSGDTLFTVEHYRPQEHYPWLALEWTNLFPTCTGCNSPKKSEFELYNQKLKNSKNTSTKITQYPQDIDAFIDYTKCNANNSDYLAEEPLFLHPEIDNGEDFITFEPSGNATTSTKLTKPYDKQRAAKMLAMFINRHPIQEKRKAFIEALQYDLLSVIDVVRTESEKKELSIREYELIFAAFFRKLNKIGQTESEFSALGKEMNQKFKAFFILPLEKKGYATDLLALISWAKDNAAAP